ncbi:hypothetical protein A3E39_04705 [Candidatus Uhrbacteria bacterium RIFCSPHIGHO2_12_FULL_60_25]|uniref:Uncharacterized protein n=1 Tax=Candidatus Uhrbacteria bacterium RIFCSPHIGHO2_12_FULL_60_25 TaxID=1802399 RepID=A0A1F7UJA7_9BACT|nr:MAG: hypothetical protein A3D73_04050 [Candidatus Uhrbacteria bacterium RIFCSPHIGHO2_02_FULL_60_44]OGL78335.1 MAG: hypothetical protein A3E39_04705 [Candidatus Uhrbacteria bacterium RIFCSPHIGHO2_12_FULL_60_25]
MLTEFASLMLTRQELMEIQEALAMRSLVEDDLRREEGLEPVDRRLLLERIDQLLNATETQLTSLEDRMDQELWHHAWYAYTDEWAWYRARQEVLKELGALAARTAASVIDDLVHRRYHEKFEDYVREIDMNPTGSERQTKERKTTKK